MKKLSCAFTGHRPSHFSFGYDESDSGCIELKAEIADKIKLLVANGVMTFYSGMALGVDQWAAEIVLEIKKEQPDIRLIAVIPCKTQADRWSAVQRERYYNLLACCDEVITLNAHYTRSCMLERNRYLVDHSDFLLAVYDGGGKGGTAYTVKYAEGKGCRIIVVNTDLFEK